jgi:FkbH-like protein
MNKTTGLFNKGSKLVDLQKYLASIDNKLRYGSQNPVVKVRILSNFSTQYLSQSLEASLHYRGIYSEVFDPGFDQWEIVLNNIESLEKVDYTILFLSTTRLVTNPNASNPVEFVKYVDNLMTNYMQQIGGELIVVLPESLREGVDTSLIFHRWTNMIKSAYLDIFPDSSTFYDLDVLVREFGISKWFDSRFFEIAKFPWHPNCNLAIGSALADTIWSIQMRPCKLIILDLDNTLWRGEVGEIGWENVGLDQNEDGFSFLMLQRMLLDLKNNGVLLALSSKNTYKNVVEVFEKRSEMILKISDFVAKEVNWDPKHKAVSNILSKLNLTEKGVMFIDDSPSERSEVKEYFPNLIVPDLPVNHADWTYHLAASKIFSLGKIKQEDLERNDMYRLEEERLEMSKTFQSYAEFLEKLELQVTLEVLNNSKLDRVYELLMKTNQFNLNGNLCSRLELDNMLTNPEQKVLAFRLKDRFGDYGIISVLILSRTDVDNWQIFNWVMSCRALGRKIEHQIIEIAVRELVGEGKLLNGEFISTGKNGIVSELLRELKFNVQGLKGKLGLKIPNDYFQKEIEKN